MTELVIPKFESKIVKLNEIVLDAALSGEISEQDRRTLIETNGVMVIAGNKQVRRIIIDGEPFIPTNRFWSSLYSRFKLNQAFFRFFTHDEVFRRIEERTNNTNLRITLERSSFGGDARLLAATAPNKPIVVYDDLLDILNSFRSESPLSYHDGTIASTHVPSIGGSNFKIKSDEFSNRFELHCPIDGYGGPSVFLSLLRWVCSNGAVAFAKTFQTALQLGNGDDNVSFTLRRALESFNNDEGFALLRDRFETATDSWASIRERSQLYRVLLGLQSDPVLKESIATWDKIDSSDLALGTANALLKSFDRVTGNPFDLYHMDPHLMGEKRQRSVPVACRVYDMLNYATELASHHVSDAGARQLQAWVGEMLSKDYDLEDSAEGGADFRDVFLSSSKGPK